MFCILSGYLSAQKNINNYKLLIKEFVLRYFRFIIPLLFINIFVYFLDITFMGFKSLNFAVLYNNNWLSTFFNNISLFKAIKNTITMGNQLNGPLWMIRPLFIGNLLIVLYNYLCQKFNNKIFKSILIFLISIGLLVGCFYYEILLYSFVTFLGVLIFEFKRKGDFNFNFLIFIILIIGIHIFNVVPIISRITTINNVSLLNTISSFVFIISLFCLKSLDNVKLNKYDLGNLSFYIYLIHWPILCSLSCSLILFFKNYTIGYVVCLIITLFVVFILAYICIKTVDKLIKKVNDNIKKLIFFILKV